MSNTAAAWILWGPLVLFAGPTLTTSGPDDGPEEDDGRVAWRYTDKELTVTITRVGGKEWVAERSDGKRPIYDETNRTAENVELQNRDTKLFVRLHTDRAYWRRPKDENWTLWVKGNWVAAPTKRVDSAVRNDHRILLALFVPRDRKPTPNFQRKIGVVMAMVNDLYQMDLKAKGYQVSDLRFESKDDKPVVQVIQGDREAKFYNNAPGYNGDEQWRRLLPEIRSKVGNPQARVMVVFAETFDDGPADHLWPGVIARGAYYGTEGGLAVFSTHVLGDQFCAGTVAEQKKLFFDETPIRGRKAWGRSMNSPRSAFAEAAIGGVAHELGHALGLPHDRRQDNQDIMGNGFRNLRWNYGAASARRVGFSEDNARLLMSSRYLATDLDLKDSQPPVVELTQVSRGPQGLVVNVKTTDDRGLRAIAFLDRNAGSLIGGRKLTGKIQEFRQTLTPLNAKSVDVKLQVIVTDNGGHQRRASLDK